MKKWCKNLKESVKLYQNINVENVRNGSQKMVTLENILDGFICLKEDSFQEILSLQKSFFGEKMKINTDMYVNFVIEDLLLLKNVFFMI